MKSNSLLTAILLLGSGIGIGIGIGRWQIQRAGETSRPTTGHQQQSAGNTTASSDVPTKIKRSTNNIEAPADIAKRLLDGILHNKLGVAGDPVERIRFQQALAQCDEATLSELLEVMQQFATDLQVAGSTMDPKAEAWCNLMVQQLAALAPMKALEAIILFKTAKLDSGETALELIFANLSQQSPDQIPAALAKLEASGFKSSGESAWLWTQAKSDPQAVFEYLIAREDKASMEDFASIASLLGLYAPDKALAAIGRYQEKGNLEWLSEAVMDAWCDRDQAAAFSHAMAQKDANLLLVFVDDPLIITDYSAIRNAFPELNRSNPEARLTLAKSLAKNLAVEDIPAARQWAATLPPAEQAKANASIASRWISDDPVAASEWLATWPAGEDKESAARMLIDEIQEDDPERALTWATSYLQGEGRYIKLAGIIKNLAIKDPMAAAAARAALSEEDRTILNYTEKLP